MIELLIDHISEISLVFMLLGTAVYAVYHRFKIRGDNLLGIVISGTLAYGIPVGVLFVFVAFYPERANKLGDFPSQLGIVGIVYIYYAIGQIKERLKKK